MTMYSKWVYRISQLTMKRVITCCNLAPQAARARVDCVSRHAWRTPQLRSAESQTRDAPSSESLGTFSTKI